MKVLLDECIPRMVKKHFPNHEVRTVPEAGWAGVKNGNLLRLAEREYDVFVTVDKNLPHQNDVSLLAMAIIILDAWDNKIATLDPLASKAAQIVETLKPGEVVTIRT